MPKLVPIPAKKLVKILKLLGFVELRRRGSHRFFLQEESKRTTTVPVHANEDVSIGTLRSILSDIELSVKEYDSVRQKIYSLLSFESSPTSSTL